MRFMVMVKATPDSEAGTMPTERELEEMGRFNEALLEAGALLSGEGLHPSSRGARVRIRGPERTVVGGPFADAQALVAGFWVWRCASLQEAIDWARRCPNPMRGESEIEIRPVLEAEDFGEALTPALHEQEDRMRARTEGRGDA